MENLLISGIPLSQVKPLVYAGIGGKLIYTPDARVKSAMGVSGAGNPGIMNPMGRMLSRAASI